MRQQIVKTRGSLSKRNPKLAKEWHPEKNGKLTPKDVTPGSQKRVWWKCKKGHEWQAVIHSRNHGYGCPCCSGLKVCKDNCLATINPKLAKEWHPEKNDTLTAKDVTPGTDRKVWWKCEKGHAWQATISSRTQGRNCPYCSHKIVCDETSLATVNPKLAKEWHPEKNGTLTPADVTPGIGKKVWWKCRKGHEWKASICERNYGQRCLYCSGRKACKDNCLATKKPKLAKEWHPEKNGKLTPKDITPGSHKKVWWICSYGHEWQAVVKNRTYGTGCPGCYNKLRREGWYSGAYTHSVRMRTR
jgi:DNA-directed RNA polymerase subunit RPC12/RpoP